MNIHYFQGHFCTPHGLDNFRNTFEKILADVQNLEGAVETQRGRKHSPPPRTVVLNSNPTKKPRKTGTVKPVGVDSRVVGAGSSTSGNTSTQGPQVLDLSLGRNMTIE